MAKLALYSAAATVIGPSLAVSVEPVVRGESQLTVAGVVALVGFAALLERVVRRAWMVRPRRLELALGVGAGVAVGAWLFLTFVVFMLVVVIHGVE